MKVVIAPDSFKGSASAADAAKAIAAGWASVRPGDDLSLVPMADGGEGTVDAFATAFPHAQRIGVRVIGPAGGNVDSSWLLLADGTGVIELADASGITLLDELRPLDAHTRGLGEVIAYALDHGARRLLIGLGGSASTDGGGGLLAALGARLLDDRGCALRDGGGALVELNRMDLSELRPPPVGGVIVLADVQNPLLGSSGAAAVYGPQKGATTAEVVLLERGLQRLSSHLPIDPATAGAGAAGGTAYGLLAWGATLAGGADAVASALGLSTQMIDADVVITGEGRFDGQTAEGKVPAHVAAMARSAGASCILLAGRIDAPTPHFDAAASVTDLASSPADALTNALGHLRELGAHSARLHGSLRRR